MWKERVGVKWEVREWVGLWGRQASVCVCVCVLLLACLFENALTQLGVFLFLTSLSSAAQCSADSGVCSAGLSTTVFPQARAGPSFHATIMIG